MSERLARAVVRRRGIVALTWLLACVALLPSARRAGTALEVAARLPGTESAAVEEALLARFESPFARNAVLVATGLPSPETPEGREALALIVDGVGAVPGVATTFSFLDLEDRSLVARDGRGTIVIAGLDPGDVSLDALVPVLREATVPLLARLRHEHPDAALRWTGQAVLNHDVRKSSTREVRQAERRALPITLALLLLAFRSLGAALVPILAGVLGIGLATGAAVVIATYSPLSLTLQSIVSMLGLGLGIDYALLTVSRFREARSTGASYEDSAVAAAQHAGHTIALSGAAVAIGFLGMLRVPLLEIRSVAVGGLLVVGVSVLMAMTLLPGALAWLGPRLELGRLPWRSTSGRSEERWLRWGRWVAAHPLPVLLLAGLPVVWLAAASSRMKTELPAGKWLPEVESTLALDDLERMGRGGVIQTIRIVMQLPEEAFALGSDGWDATRTLAATLAADPRVDRVRSLPDVAGERADDLAYVSFLPSSVKRAFVSREGDAALVELVPREGMTTSELARFVRELRCADAVALTGLDGVALSVGGLPGFNVDFEDAVAGRFPGVVALVVSGTFLALLVGFRSVLIPIKAVGLNLLSVAAAFGAVVLVFQEGVGASWLGLDAATGSVFRTVPIYAFCIVFGLSMDYEVFLVARVAEARRDGLPEAEALAYGLAKTGGIITSAAAIMIAVFGAFTLGGMLLTKMLGFALAVAVLLDGTIIRTAVGPALLRLAGRYNWWPS